MGRCWCSQVRITKKLVGSFSPERNEITNRGVFVLGLIMQREPARPVMALDYPPLVDFLMLRDVLSLSSATGVPGSWVVEVMALGAVFLRTR